MRSISIARRVVFNHPSATTGGVREARFISEGVRGWGDGSWTVAPFAGETSMRGRPVLPH